MSTQKNLLIQDLSNITVNDFEKYLFKLLPSTEEGNLHRQNLQHLFKKTFTEAKNLHKSRKVIHRHELAILLNPCSLTRSPHIEMALNLHFLAQSINIPTSIYISNIPSLGNIVNFEKNYSKENWHIERVNIELSSLIRSLTKNKQKAPKVVNLHKQWDQNTKLLDIVHESVNNLFVGDSFPYHSIAFSGGGSSFLGGWGLEWLDPISLYSKHRSLALMGWHDIPIIHNFYRSYIGPQDHPLKDFNPIKDKFKNFSIVKEEPISRPPTIPGEDEKKLYSTVEKKVLNHPLLIFASNDLHKRTKIQDIISLIRLKSQIPSLKLIVIGRNSEEFKNLLLEISIDECSNNQFRFKFTLPKSGTTEVEIKFNSNTTIDTTLYNSMNVFNFNSFTNIEDCLSMINKLRSKQKSPTLFTHFDESGNGVSNTIAGYSGLTSLFKMPNDSSRSLPKEFFVDDLELFYSLTKKILRSYDFYNKFRKLQSMSLKNHIDNYDIRSEAKKLLL